MSSFIKDPVTKMVINTNDSHYQSILHARHAEKEAHTLREKLETMDKAIDDISEMKLKLEQLIIAGNSNVKTSS